MITFTANQLVDRAKSLADLDNSSFIQWGENHYYINLAYKQIYNDLIAIGDTTYLKEVALDFSGTATFDIPDDFYQLSSLVDANGNEISRRRIGASPTESGYEIVNNQLRIYHIWNGAVLRYYPIPETILHRAEPVKLSALAVNRNYSVGWNDKVARGDTLYDINQDDWTTEMEDNITLVGNGFFAIDSDVYDWNGNLVQSFSNYPALTESGFIVEQPDWIDRDAGVVCSDDQRYWFYYRGGSWYFADSTITDEDGEVVENRLDIPESGDLDCRYLTFEGKPHLLTRTKLIQYDGTWISTDNPNAVAILKADQNTGYGYLTYMGSSLGMQATGWAPNTIIDYPSNTLFDMCAIQLAIYYRIKQNSDSTALQNMYNSLKTSYMQTISQDGSNYTTIRNVDSQFTRLAGYY